MFFDRYFNNIIIYHSFKHEHPKTSCLPSEKKLTNNELNEVCIIESGNDKLGSTINSNKEFSFNIDYYREQNTNLLYSIESSMKSLEEYESFNKLLTEFLFTLN